MARLILKSPYLQCDRNHPVSGYLQYIGTRERVELLPDDRPPTRKQEQLVRKLTKDFPSSKKLDEYSDYEAKPTKANASAFITRALEENWPAVQQSDGYMKYIATRPRAERLGDHGLFGDEDGVDLEKAMRELDQYTGNVWTHTMMRFGPNSWARKVWYRKRKTQKCHLRFCGTVNKKGHSFRKGGALQVVKTEIRLWYFCGQTRNRRGKNHGDFHFGGPDRIRTDDPYNANVVRSQLRYRPLLAIFQSKKL